MKITSVRIRRVPEERNDCGAVADVVLEGCLALKGIRLRRGRYGYFLSFPRESRDSPARIFETTTNSLLGRLRTAILHEYERASARADLGRG